jgi:hypothetical protein
MLQKLDDNVVKRIIKFACYTDFECFFTLEKVCKAWKEYVKEIESDFDWNESLVIHPFNISAKQTFFQEVDARHPRFLSNDTLCNQRQDWRLFITELTEKCDSLKKELELEDHAVLFSSLEKFLKEASFKQEMLILCTKPEAILWNNLSFSDIIMHDDDNLLNFFISYHPRTIPFLLLTKEKKILCCIDANLLGQVASCAPQFIPLILENPHPDIKGLLNSHNHQYYKEEYEKYCTKKASMTSEQPTTSKHY